MTQGQVARSLADRLGVRTDAVALLVAVPEAVEATGCYEPIADVTRVAAPTAREFVAALSLGPFDFLHVFEPDAALLEEVLPQLLRALAPDGVIWVSWPKRGAGVASDVTDDVVRAAALPLGLVDVKACSVDETWWALKLVLRPENRVRR